MMLVFLNIRASEIFTETSTTNHNLMNFLIQLKCWQKGYLNGLETPLLANHTEKALLSSFQNNFPVFPVLILVEKYSKCLFKTVTVCKKSFSPQIYSITCWVHLWNNSCVKVLKILKTRKVYPHVSGILVHGSFDISSKMQNSITHHK